MSEEFSMRRGLAWYVGQQGGDNSLTEEPGGPYLCEPPPEVVARCRYGAHLARLPWRDREYTLLFFVDPATQRFFAQPHPESAAVSQVDWGVPDARASRSFAEARKFARRAYGKQGEDENPSMAPWWEDFTSWRKPSVPPPPVDLPGNPARAYEGSGWRGWGDWLLTPPPKKKKRKSTARKSRRARTA